MCVPYHPSITLLKFAYNLSQLQDAGSAGLAYLALLILYCRQSERSRTPPSLARISRWTFLSQATVDSVSFAGHITFAILAEGRPSLTLIAPAFLSCLLFVFEAVSSIMPPCPRLTSDGSQQFSILVHQIQAPENVVVPSPPPATPSPPPPSPPLVTADVETSYPPAPAQPPGNQTPTRPTQQARPPTATSQGEPSSFLSFFIHHIRTDPQARLCKLILFSIPLDHQLNPVIIGFTLFIFLTLVVRVILSPTLSMVFVGITYSFIWLPQIIRSVRRGRSSGLSKEYVVGTTVCRLSLALCKFVF